MKCLLLVACVCSVGAVLVQAATLKTKKNCNNALSVEPLQLESDAKAFFTIANSDEALAQEEQYMLNLPLGTVFETMLDGEGDDTIIGLPKQLAQEVYDALKTNGQSTALFTVITSDLLNYAMSITLQPEEEAVVTLLMNADYGSETETNRLNVTDETSDCSEESKIIKKLLPNFEIPETLEFHNNDFLRDFEGLDKEDALIAFALEKKFPTHKTSVVSYKNNNSTRAVFAKVSEKLDCDYECFYKWDIDRDFPPKKGFHVSTPTTVPEFRITTIQKKFVGMNLTPLLGSVAGVYQYQISNPSDTYEEALFYINGPALLVNCTVDLDKGKSATYKTVTRKRGQIEYNNIKITNNQTAIYLAKVLRKDNVVSHQCAVFMEPRSSIIVNFKFFNKNTQESEAQVDIFHNSNVLSLGYDSDPNSTTERLLCPDSEETDDRVEGFTFYPYSIYRSTRKASLLITSEPFPEVKNELLETEYLASLFTLEGLCP